MVENWLIGAALLAPVGGAVGSIASRRSPNWREAASLVAAGVVLASLAFAVPAVAAGERPGFSLFEILPGIEIAFEIEPLGLLFALLAAFLWLVTVIYSIGYLRANDEQAQTRFYVFFAISIAAAIGGALAANLLTLYLFYELLTIATYPLVIHGGKRKDLAGGRKYLLILFATSLLFLLTAIVWTFLLTGSLDFRPGGLFAEDGPSSTHASAGLVAVIYALFLFGTGKAALMPFHQWLPAAMVAPTPVSALLHAVAVVKLGVFAILKVTVYVFGIDLLAELDASRVMRYVAAATLLLAGTIALRERNIKKRLAYSTISQLAYIVLAASLANGTAFVAGGIHILAHALSKITLFFCAGAFLVVLHKTRTDQLAGVGRRMPITMAAWIVASLGVIGMPLTGGFWSKWYLAWGTLEAGEPLLLAAVLSGSLLAMGYLLPPAVRAFFPAARELKSAPAGSYPEAPLASLAAIVIAAGCSVLLFVCVGPIKRLLEEVLR